MSPIQLENPTIPYTLHGCCRPMFVDVDEISFRRPVAVGDLLRLNSMVLYTSNNLGDTKVRVRVQGSRPRVLLPRLTVVRVGVRAG